MHFLSSFGVIAVAGFAVDSVSAFNPFFLNSNMLPAIDPVIPDCGQPSLGGVCFNDHMNTLVEYCDMMGVVAVQPVICPVPWVPPAPPCTCPGTDHAVIQPYDPSGFGNNWVRCFEECTCSGEDVWVHESSCNTCGSRGLLTTSVLIGKICCDPHFRTLYGNVGYDFHGEVDRVFNVISAEKFQLNSRFVTSGGKGSREGERTFLGEMGIITGDDYLYLNHVNCTGTLNGKPLNEGQTSFTNGNLEYVTISEGHHHEAGFFDLTTTIPGAKDQWLIRVSCQSANRAQHYFNMDIDYNVMDDANVPALPHGVLGQTARHKDYKAAKEAGDTQAFVEGSIADYEIEGDNLFGQHYTFNVFAQ